MKQKRIKENKNNDIIIKPLEVKIEPLEVEIYDYNIKFEKEK